jgi:hypothetical protein
MKSRRLLSLFLTIAGCGPFLNAQSPGTFTTTGSMITPRFSHTATLLPDGRVLIAGGNTVCFVPGPCLGTNTAELYDPATGTFTSTGTMSPADLYVGGLLMADGRVFFASSSNYASGPLAAIELYDPSTGTFNLVGTAAALTQVATATLLNDGRVLLTGYAGNYSAFGTEIYDPIAETSTSLSNSLPDAPSAAILVADGRVVLQFYERDAQIYDPISGSFTSTGGLCCFDDPPQASLLLNRYVLFTGGNLDPSGNTSSVELYDPAVNIFGGMKMSIARDGHTSTLLPDDTVLIAGGSPFSYILDSPTATAEIYDPAAAGFSATAGMNTARSLHAATLLNSGQVLVTGGSAFGSLSSVSAMASAELYTPAVLIPAPTLFSLSGDGTGQGAIWNSMTGQIASGANPATAGDVLSMYTTSLFEGGVIPPRVAIGGQLAEVLYFGDAPGYPGYFQVNFRVPNGVAPGSAVPVRLTYIGRPTNAVTIGVQ